MAISQAKSNLQINVHLGRNNSNPKNTSKQGSMTSSTPVALSANALNSFHAIYSQPSSQQQLFQYQQQQNSQQPQLAQAQQNSIYSSISHPLLQGQQIRNGGQKNHAQSVEAISNNTSSENEQNGIVNTQVVNINGRHTSKQNSTQSVGQTQNLPPASQQGTLNNSRKTSNAQKADIINSGNAFQDANQNIQNNFNGINTNPNINNSNNTTSKQNKNFSITQNKLSFSPNKAVKPKSTHFNIAASFQSHRSAFGSASTPSNLLQQQNPPQLNFNNPQITSPIQQQQTLANGQQSQNGKTVFSPMKTFFKSTTNLDTALGSTSLQQQNYLQNNVNSLSLNKSQVNMHFNPNLLHNTLSVPQQLHSQSTKNTNQNTKDQKGPFFFPSMTKKQPLLQPPLQQSQQNNNMINLTHGNSVTNPSSITNIKSNNNSIINLTQNVNLRKGSIQENQLGMPLLVNQQSSNSSSELNILRSERDSLKIKIEKLELEREEIAGIALRQTNLKQIAIDLLKRIKYNKNEQIPLSSSNSHKEREKKQENLKNNQTNKTDISSEIENILEIESQLEEELQLMHQILNTTNTNMSDSLASPKTDAQYEVRKNSMEKLSEDVILKNSKQNSFRISLKRSSLPGSPKRKLLEKPSYFPFHQSNHSAVHNDILNTKMQATFNNNPYLSSAGSHQNSLSGGQTNSTMNSLGCNKKPSIEDNTKSSSQIMGNTNTVLEHSNESSKQIYEQLHIVKERVAALLNKQLKNELRKQNQNRSQQQQQQQQHSQQNLQQQLQLLQNESQQKQ